MRQNWKDFLQENGIHPVVSAAPWQRGRIERYGLQEMLTRMDHHKPIENLQQFGEALRQCFRAKNSMSVISGSSPKQAVLGRAAKLPASIVSDEDSSAQLLSQGSDLASDRFREKFELRAARIFSSGQQ